MFDASPVTDAEELLDLLTEHRRTRIARMVRSSAMDRELDLPALMTLQNAIETVERALSHEGRLTPMSTPAQAEVRKAIN
jgi:hypothetical protein